MTYIRHAFMSFFVVFASIAISAQTPVSSGYVDYQKIIDVLYNQVSGYRISEEEKKSIRDEGGDPTYGEILFESAQVLLEDLELTPDDVLYDLGSGSGKFICQVYLTTPVKKAAGIELSKTRYKTAQVREPKIRKIAQLSSKFDQEIQELLMRDPSTPPTSLKLRRTDKASNGQETAKDKSPDKRTLEKQKTTSKTLQFINGNVLTADLSDATVVFMCSTCFSDELMKKITDKLVGLQEGLRVLTLKDLPPHEHFKLIRQYTLPMSWSKSSAGSPVYLYELDRTQPSHKATAGEPLDLGEEVIEEEVGVEAGSEDVGEASNNIEK